VIEELRELRRENRVLAAQNNQYLKKISTFYRTAQNDDGTALRVEAAA
jgi:hypothetical protein